MNLFIINIFIDSFIFRDRSERERRLREWEEETPRRKSDNDDADVETPLIHKVSEAERKRLAPWWPKFSSLARECILVLNLAMSPPDAWWSI